MPTPPLRRTIVTLRFPSSNPALISLARAILAALAANPLFANIEPPLAVVSAATDELDLAQIGAGTRARGAVETRDEKRVALVRLLVQLRIGVQKVADAHPADAEIIAASAGMSTKRPGGRRRNGHGVREGGVSGTAVLTTLFVRGRVAYQWQMSADGGATWVDLPVTVRATTTVTGLRPGATYLFRSRSVTARITSNWSSPLSFIAR